LFKKYFLLRAIWYELDWHWDGALREWRVVHASFSLQLLIAFLLRKSEGEEEEDFRARRP
jgi:hypothetical protein